jgi:hypothetical protein
MRSRSGFVVGADQSVTFDVPLFAVATQVRLDGVTPVDLQEGFEEVVVRFTNVTTQVRLEFGFDSRGVETFQVPGGTYDVDLIVTNPGAAAGAPVQSPMRSRSGFVVGADQSVTFDVPLFAVATQVRLDGVAPVDLQEGFEEVIVRFTNVTTQVRLEFGFDSRGVETFQVPGGTYDVDLIVTNPGAAAGAPVQSPLRAASCLVVGP